MGGRLTDADKATARWRAPDEMGHVAIRVRVSDGSASASAVVHVDVDPTAVPALPLGGALLLINREPVLPVPPPLSE